METSNPTFTPTVWHWEGKPLGDNLAVEGDFYLSAGNNVYRMSANDGWVMLQDEYQIENARNLWMYQEKVRITRANRCATPPTYGNW
jgi:hypothetical protein